MKLKWLLVILTLLIVTGCDNRQSQSRDTGFTSQSQDTYKEEVPKETIVYITRTGSKYHRADCRYLRESSIVTTLKKARAGYGPCKVCKPPE